MDNFRFANPQYLWLLCLIAVLIAVFILGRYLSGKALKRFGAVSLLQPLMQGVSRGKLTLKFTLLMIALTCMIIAAARPQFGSKLETVKKEGVEVVVCLDISNSMKAQDVSPNRLSKAKRMLSRMLDKMENDKVGLIIFAGEAVVQLPITADYVSAKMFLDGIEPGSISAQGTAIDDALSLAMRSFSPSEESSKAIVLITDAEDQEGDAVRAATAASEQKIPVNVVGVGTTMGKMIPDESGLPNSFMKDRAGNPVTTRFNEGLAKSIAKAGNGVYVHAGDNDNDAIASIVENLHKMKAVELEQYEYSEYNDQFFWFALAALFFLLVDIFLLDRANLLLSKIKIFD